MNTVNTVLANAAFGNDPQRWPLPAASTPLELWLRAVAAGGQGRYDSALTDLDGVHRLQRSGPLVSLAHSTRASYLRQLGWHEKARGWDGRAMAQARGDREAGADALIGLAADALGVGRFAASALALGRARDLLADTAPPRLPVRLAWVSAELAMARGDGDTAVGHAERAVQLATTLGSTRHAVKSAVVMAAALGSAGDIDGARRVADAALPDADRAGLIPLCWALACLLDDIGSAAYAAPEVVRIRHESAATVRRRGGDLSDR
jgi:ATP/maltotriose-dependent transcriptional regulator MalT